VERRTTCSIRKPRLLGRLPVIAGPVAEAVEGEIGDCAAAAPKSLVEAAPTVVTAAVGVAAATC
jgi:hypothetical protein